MSLQNPNDCNTMYRSPDSYIIGTQAYYDWLNCGLDNNSAQYGYNSGNTGGGWNPPLVSGGGGSYSPPINQVIPMNTTAPIRIPMTVASQVGVGKQTPEQPNPSGLEPTIVYTTQQDANPIDKLKQFYNENQLLSLGVLALAGYLVFVKK